jgi:predicted nuclease of predicted toxin-antitoxin system
MKFLFDEDTNAKTCSALRKLGHQAQMAQRVGYGGTKDEYVAEFADRIGAVFVSFDVVFHRDRQKQVMKGFHVLLVGSKRRSPTWFVENLSALIAKIDGRGPGFFTLWEDGTIEYKPRRVG